MGPIKNAVRHFNKVVTNPILGRLAGARFGPFALIRHKGRKSGKQYATPVMVFPFKGGFMVALTYGPEVDWYKNVLAAGECGVRWHAQEYAVSGIEPAPTAEALPYFPSVIRSAVQFMGTEHYVRLSLAQARATNE
ncbi:MAG: nitroreductase family deazaflavin-dependent oxidoreductase [Anaerolineae bacterium]|nr:nitroreductase family deazaflavin-dependent oxidoreductase [Anaerolineae bacterium]